MKRTNGEVLRDLRKKNNLTMEELAKIVGKSTSFVNEMEKDRRPIPREILEEVIEKLSPTKKDIEELRENIIEKNLPKVLKNTNLKIITDELKTFKYKVYPFDTSSGGMIDIKKYREEHFMAEKKINVKSLIVEVIGKELEPLCYNGDKVLFEFEEFKDWTSLNKKLIAFKYKGDYMIRKVKFYQKKPYLLALESDVYEDIDVLEHAKDIEYIGQLSRLLDRNFKNSILD